MEKRNKISIQELLKKKGAILSENINGIALFEANVTSNHTPFNWNNPANILRQGKRKNAKFNSISENTVAQDNLSMAARDGKKIDEETRRLMDSDRKNAKGEE